MTFFYFMLEICSKLYLTDIYKELPNGLIIEFIYDEEQNLIKEFDNEGKEVLYTYDKSKRKSFSIQINKNSFCNIK